MRSVSIHEPAHDLGFEGPIFVHEHLHGEVGIPIEVVQESEVTHSIHTVTVVEVALVQGVVEIGIRGIITRASEGRCFNFEVPVISSFQWSGVYDQPHLDSTYGRFIPLPADIDHHQPNCDTIEQSSLIV